MGDERHYKSEWGVSPDKSALCPFMGMDFCVAALCDRWSLLRDDCNFQCKSCKYRKECLCTRAKLPVTIKMTVEIDDFEKDGCEFKADGQKWECFTPNTKEEEAIKRFVEKHNHEPEYVIHHKKYRYLAVGPVRKEEKDEA